MEIGKTTFETRGRTWLLVATEPYTRRNGSVTQLLVWQTKCAKCEDPVTVKTPTKGYESSNCWGAKHCNAHKLTRVQVLRLWTEQRKAQKTANTQKEANSNA